MRNLLLFILVWLPFLVQGQVDTAAVQMKIDSLVLASRESMEKGQLENALKIILTAEEITEKIFGQASKQFAICKFTSGWINYRFGKYDAAENQAMIAKNIQEKLYGKNNIDFASTLNLIANILRAKGLYSEAEDLYLKTKELRLNLLGEIHEDYSTTLKNLSLLYQDLGDYDKAKPLLLDAANIRERLYGRNHPMYGDILSNLGVLYEELGDYNMAESIYAEAKKIAFEALGDLHQNYASKLNDLAILFRLTGDYEKSEIYYLDAVEIYRKTLGEQHPHYASTVNNLANLCREKGEYSKAETLYLEAMEIRRKIFGEEHSDFAKSMDNLSILYNDIKKYDTALYYGLEAKKIFSKSLGENHLTYSRCLQSLAIIYLAKKDYLNSELYFLKALELRKIKLGDLHPDYAETLNNLGVFYLEISRYEKSESILLECEKILKRLGDNHPSRADCLFNLALLYSKKNNTDKAIDYLIKANNANKHLISNASKYNSEKEIIQYQHLFQDNFHTLLTFTQKYKDGNLCKTSFDNSLFLKNRLLFRTIEWEKIKSLHNSRSINIYKEWKSLHFRIARWHSIPKNERDTIILTTLEEKANTLEKELVRTVAGFGEALRQVTWQEVLAVLKPGEAAIEFVSYRYHDPEPTDSTMYAALVLRHGDSEPGFFTLFEEREIAPLLAGASGLKRVGINLLYTVQSNDNGQKSLYDLIWKPLQPELEGVKTVYCSPAGLLHRLNLGAIAMGGGKAFSDEHQLVVLGSTRRLVVKERAVPQTNVARVIGGVQYDNDSTAIADAIRLDAETRGMEPSDGIGFHPADSLRGDTWNYLPESETEALELRQILRNTGHAVQLDTGYMATEESIKRLGTEGMSPYILHVATHGFFFPDPKETPASKRGLAGQEPVFKMSEHPMMRSGLMLAGAQEAWATGKAPEGREDGILTAYEISQLNLSNTELVVLSACETGLGDIKGNEGVYGLQRAFKIAGAKYLIMSLWVVNDKSTREFMTEFYRQWLEKRLKIPEAFRMAQANMKAAKPDSPYLWAGFVLVE